MYGKVIKNLSSDDEYKTIFGRASGLGIGWGRAGGENLAIGGANHLAVDGINNCIEVLEEIELNKLSDIDYIECQACIGGCIGGVLTVENQFVARVRIRRLSEKLGCESSLKRKDIIEGFENGYYSFEEKILPEQSLKLDNDAEMLDLSQKLPPTIEKSKGGDNK